MGTRSADSSVGINVVSTIFNEIETGAKAELKIGGAIVADKLKNGAEENQANRAFRYIFTISSAAEQVVDVYDLGSLDIGAGAGLDGLGQAWVCEEIVWIMIRQKSGDGRLEINLSAATNPIPWIPTMTVANGGALQNGALVAFYNPDTDGFDITDASAHQFRLTATGGDVVVDLMVIGRSDDEVSSSSSSSSTNSSSVSSSSSSRSTSSSSSTSSISSSSTSTVSSVSSSTNSSSSSSST